MNGWARDVLLGAEEMRSVEQAVIESGAVTGLELMERAGRGVVEAVFEEWPDLETTDGRALVLCGPGNNGGDGFVVARLLQARGWQVEVFLYGDSARLPPDAAANRALWTETGKIRPLAEAPSALAAPDSAPTLVIDALFGIGISRPLPDAVAGVLRDIANWRDRQASGAAARIVAVDLPSGLQSDSGAGDQAAPADLTVSFHRPKLGHVLARGPELCGRLRMVDIGIEELPPGAVPLVGPPLAGPLGKRAGHKFSHGHALVLAGGPGRGGAARLAARAALRVGAGLVTLACPPAALAENAAHLDAVMLRPLPDARALEAMLGDARLGALCLGPGLGLDDRAAGLVEAALASDRPAVLDADALTLIAARGRVEDLGKTRVLTPHAGEFARLFPDLQAKLVEAQRALQPFSKIDTTREAAQRAGAVVLYKGADTVIAAPDGRGAVHAAAYEMAAPWLATAGAGDVLAGLIGGLLARGYPAFEAATTAAWLHGECARSFGPGLIAEDLPEELPRVFRSLCL